MVINTRYDGVCECCGEPTGRCTQAPYPMPLSNCLCDDCHALESIAFGVWRELNPGISTFNAPIPFLKGKQDYPPEILKGAGKAAELKDWFRQKLKHQGKRIKNDNY